MVAGRVDAGGDGQSGVPGSSPRVMAVGQYGWSMHRRRDGRPNCGGRSGVGMRRTGISGVAR